MDDLYQFLPNLMPFYTARLGQVKVVEPSEEIRLQIIKTLAQVVARTGDSFSPFVEETVDILGRTCQDSYQDIRKVIRSRSCSLISGIFSTHYQSLQVCKEGACFTWWGPYKDDSTQFGTPSLVCKDWRFTGSFC